jgi:hypothetical protein
MTEKKNGPMLHELLAALGDSQKRSDLAQQEAKETFTKRAGHFRGGVKTLTLLADTEEARAIEKASAEHGAVTTSVAAKLRYLNKPVTSWWNACLQKEATNQEAKADLVVSGKTIASDLPAGFLLAMERELKQFRSVLEEIPTHEPGKTWVPTSDVVAQDGSKEIFKNAVPTVRPKEKKVLKPVEMSPATKEHPAQVQAVNEVETLGTFEIVEYASTVSPAAKSDMLARVSELLKAVKKARMRANQTPVVKKAVGSALFRYILEGGEVRDEFDEEESE